jgi:DNA (cytosine-5)-methyltransferase 1
MANHPMAEHICEDLNTYEKRRLPRTCILWGSPFCTEISPAGGRKRTRGQTEIEVEGAALGHRLRHWWSGTRSHGHDALG